MLTQHKYYVYHDGRYVMARMETRGPVIAEVLDTPQAAYDKVQSILNPHGKAATEFGARGFHEPAFQAAISGLSESYVRGAYAKADAEKRRKGGKR